MKCQCMENICLCWEHNQRSNSCWGDTQKTNMDTSPQTYQSVFPSTLKYYNGAVDYSMWRVGAVCCFFIPISGKICWSQTLHVLTLLKLTSRKEVIKYELVYLRDHIYNKCSIRTRHRSYTALPSLLCIRLMWVCTLQFVITFPSW